MERSKLEILKSENNDSFRKTRELKKLKRQEEKLEKLLNSNSIDANDLRCHGYTVDFDLFDGNDECVITQGIGYYFPTTLAILKERKVEIVYWGTEYINRVPRGSPWIQISAAIGLRNYLLSEGVNVTEPRKEEIGELIKRARDIFQRDANEKNCLLNALQG